MTITIYRFGNYINKVNCYNDLRSWILSNVDEKSHEIGISKTLDECMEIAKGRGYSFGVNHSETRERDIIEQVSIDTIAEKFTPLTRKGTKYIGRCPICESTGELQISIAKQTFTCKACGKTGNSIELVALAKKCTENDAMEWIEKTFNIK